MKYIEVKDAIAYNKYDIGLEREQIFDTDSFSIGVDNKCSGWLSNKVKDFVGPLKDSHRVIKGFVGTNNTNNKIGTIKWSWFDDTG